MISVAQKPTPMGDWVGIFMKGAASPTSSEKRESQGRSNKKKGFIPKTTPKQSPVCGFDWQIDIADEHVCYGSHSFPCAPIVECPKLKTCKIARKNFA